jgi:coiled-coil and C2 domain-containing protein 1
VRKTPQSRQEKQLAFLVARQKEFKEAALQAKRKGEVNQAKEYLRLAKGFDPLIEASNSGLPVDMDTVSSIWNLFMGDIISFCPSGSLL